MDADLRSDKAGMGPPVTHEDADLRPGIKNDKRFLIMKSIFEHR